MTAERSMGSEDGRVAHAATRDRSFNAASVLSIVAVLFLLVLCAAPLIEAHSNGYIAPSREPMADATPYAEPSKTRLIPSWNELSWDWSSLADESGSVDVIISIDRDPAGLWDPLDGLLDRLTHTGHEDPELVAAVEQGLRAGADHRFLLTLNGLSARLSVDFVEALLTLDPSVQIYPDLPVQATLTASVPMVGADLLWSRTDPAGQAVLGAGVTVAVIDTGVDYTHPDLGGGFGPGYKVIGGYDFVNRDSDPIDDNGHGTHVAGIVAADGPTVKGVAPGASILAYKVLGHDGTGSMSNVIAAIERSMDPDGDGDPSDRAHIISMSLGGPGQRDDPVCLAVKRATEAGIVVVVAAGNSGPSLGSVMTPGLAPEAITVGAIDGSGKLADFSSRGTVPELLIKPEISAPGVQIYSTVPKSNALYSSSSGYMRMSGTSMATPHVSGAAALLLQLHPDWTPQQVKSALALGSGELSESLWTAGAGALWAPGAADMTIFASDPVISYGSALDASVSVSLTNQGASVTLQVGSEDWSSLSADGSSLPRSWWNISSVSPSSVTVSPDGTITLTVGQPPQEAPEGFYEGLIILEPASGEAVRMPFGFALLSRVNVKVIDTQGREVLDPYGGVWVYDMPDAQVAIGVRGGLKPAPPASFLLPSGTYSVHAAGHQLLYDYADPYLLSGTFSLGRLETRDVELRMSNARQLTIDLSTEDQLPIYVKDYRVYYRYEGVLRNVSFHLLGSDYSVRGDGLFTLPSSKTVFVSDTAARVGISVAGFAYSPAMHEFMRLNWDHWFEYTSGVSTEFLIEASADLQYLLSWEFDGIDGTTPLTLSWKDGQTSSYETKYDIPGSIGNVWCDWGNHRAMGGDASFYVRRDTSTSLNSFFSGMTRKTVVLGVFSELYFPGSLFEGFFERQYYDPDHDHLVRAATSSEIYLPDRNFLTPLAVESVVERLGAGPYYPALQTANTNETLVIFHPLLRDQSGAKVGGMNTPTMNLYRNGQFVGVYQLSEHQARPDAVRVVSLSNGGSYSAKISYAPTPQICNEVSIELGFIVPGTDVDPPSITGLQMPQRFLPGSSVPLQLTAADDRSTVEVQVSWRPSASASWSQLTVSTLSEGTFGASVQTLSDTAAIHLKVRVTDGSGNYIEYIAANAALKEIPVIFELSSGVTELSYRDSAESVLLEGRLTDLSGNPLSSVGGIPLELMVDGKKVGMLLDEYVTSSSHTHNGSIRFEWRVNPMTLFTGPDETVQVTVGFDLSIYEPVERSITLRSVEHHNAPPVITLNSPANNSLIAAGTVIDLHVTDDGGAVVVEAYLDGKYYMPLLNPWDVDTAGWSDGAHQLEIVATDQELAVTSRSYQFDVDAIAPQVEILFPKNGTLVPRNSTLTASVSDRHLAEVLYSVDGGAPVPLQAPYEIDMTGWPLGEHTVTVTATDLVGHSTVKNVWFEIASGDIVASLDSPTNGAVVRSGTPISFSVLGQGSIECTWRELGGATHQISEPYVIATDGWSEGLHEIVINASNDLGGWFELSVSVTLDDTPPTIILEYPANGSFVEPSDQIWLRVVDANFDLLSWTLWGRTVSSGLASATVYLTSPPGDGYFVLEVRAFDLAGNQAVRTYTFALDSAPPLLSAGGVSSGDALMTGYEIDLTVEDPFLSHVQWSVDGGEPMALNAPYRIDTAGLPDGWRGIQIVAHDHSGKSSMLNLTVYLDGQPPVVELEAPEGFLTDRPLEIRAGAHDNHLVESVVLFYELSDGSFAQIPMEHDGTLYVATLDPGLLWDNMSLFVSARDGAGNVGESDPVTISSLGYSPPGGGDADGGAGQDGSGAPAPSDGSDDELDGGLLPASSRTLLLSVLSALAASLIILMFMMARRGHADASFKRAVSRSCPAAVATEVPRGEMISREYLFSGESSMKADGTVVQPTAPTHAPEKRAADHVECPRMRLVPKPARPSDETFFDRTLKMVIHAPVLGCSDEDFDESDGDFISREPLSFGEELMSEPEETDADAEMDDLLFPKRVSGCEMRRMLKPDR